MLRNNYHDATLLDAQLDWATGGTKLRLRLCARDPTVATLRFDGVSDFSWPRRFPWGKSNSVNDVRCPIDGSIEIEMQSGDVIRILASEYDESTTPDRGE